MLPNQIELEWNSGIISKMVSVSLAISKLEAKRMLARWERRAPLGVPVVPEVYPMYQI
jgi:hypothetical protein